MPVSRIFTSEVAEKPLGVIEDRAVQLVNIPTPLRLVHYRDQETGTEYRFVTIVDHLEPGPLLRCTRKAGR